MFFLNPTDSTYLWWQKNPDSCSVTFWRDSLYVVGGSLSVVCAGAMKAIPNIDNRFSVNTDSIINDTARATKLIIVDQDPANSYFSDSLALDIIRAIGWEEYAGSNDTRHCNGHYNPQWNNYWDDVITGSDTCFETRYPCENIISTATGTMQMIRTVWEPVFNAPGFGGEPPGYFVCRWDSLAWNWRINVFNGKYIHQVSMFSHMSRSQRSWDSLYFPSSDYTPDSLNREDLAVYGYKEGATEMSLIKDIDDWNASVRDYYYIDSVRKYKDTTPWGN